MYINLLDVPVLVVISFAVALRDSKVWKKINPDIWYLASLGIILVFWLDALLVALGVLDRPWGLPFGAVPVNPWAALVIVLSYPLWYNWSTENALRFFGRTPQQEGLVWPFTTGDRSEPFEPAWRSHDSDTL